MSTPGWELPPELLRAKAASYAMVDAAAAACTAATGGAPSAAGTGPPVGPAGVAVSDDYAAALDYLDCCVHSATYEYTAEAARRFLAAVIDATMAPELGAALTALRAALADMDAALADTEALTARNRARRAAEPPRAT